MTDSTWKEKAEASLRKAKIKSLRYEAIEKLRNEIYSVIDTSTGPTSIDEEKMWIKFHSMAEKMSLYYEKHEQVPCWKH